MLNQNIGDTKYLPKISVAIPTKGRRHIVARTVAHILENQTYLPTEVIISCSDPVDVGLCSGAPNLRIVISKNGLAAQRNAALDNIDGASTIVVFFDDDFVPANDYLEKIAKKFKAEDDLAGLTGEVLLDGIKGPGINFDQAARLLLLAPPLQPASDIEPFSPYGCNMAFRVSAIKGHRFDERLVLYGWLEDRDFGGALINNGARIIKYRGARGVHLGTKLGRVAGLRLGYSQVVNPLYMWRKGTMSASGAVTQITRNVVSNIMRSAFPEDYVDRRGRLVGNLKGFYDILKRTATPERAADL